jgi:hypothetical protein
MSRNKPLSWRIEKDMGNLRRIVLDVLKPLEPNIVDLVQKVSTLTGVEGVNITIYEIDHHVENAKITVEGEQLSYRDLEELIIETGGAVHSIDEVAAGKRTVEEVVTHQD